ncbi:MAG: DNA polymerase II large subunit [Methanobacteriota archaeon]|nr:MAG: DNA polymerase II large subunit [Euryarchaeota archaeon]
MTAVASKEIEDYFESLEHSSSECYKVAQRARKMGYDPQLHVEILKADDLASRVEQLLGDYTNKGISRRIRELGKDMDREAVSLQIAREIAKNSKGSREEALEKAIRTGLAILTEGILVAPLEGVASAKIGKNTDGSTYADVYYAGPIRSAGGTGQALSVLIADVVRRDLGIGRYKPTKQEVERFKEEIPLYKRSQHLQYTPTSEEIELMVSNCPVCINGEGTEDEEISGHRDLPRIATNKVRGGACLVTAEGLCLKAPKIQKHVRNLKIDGWDFIGKFIKRKGSKDEESMELKPDDKYIRNIIAGRPVLAHPSRKGGFRLRYGRTRATGLAALGVNPATMAVVGEFIAVGTQMKIERPGKACAVTPSDDIEGPMVVLRNGDFVRLDDYEEAKRLIPEIERITDLGEILVPFGEFLENNHVLVPGSYSIEWYEQELLKKCKELPDDWESPTPSRAFEMSESHGVPLHPKYNLFWHDLTVEDIGKLRKSIENEGKFEDGQLTLPRDESTVELLVQLGAPHRIEEESVLVGDHSYAIVRCLGLEVEDSKLHPRGEIKGKDSLECVSEAAGVTVRPKSPTRVGARMARPEKAKERMMKPPPHSLFPLGNAGGAQRLVQQALSKGRIKIEVGKRVCEECGKRWSLSKCTCGGHTKPIGEPVPIEIRLDELYRAAAQRIGESSIPNIKGVKGMISKDKTPEALEKGMLRAKHGVYVFKDGTCRFDMTDVPLTHFKPAEIGISLSQVKVLGYEKDVNGNPIEDENQLVELRPQDFIASSGCGRYMVKVSNFIDDMLAKVYGLKPFYSAEKKEDLIGHVIVGLAPHTSSGVLARLIGYTDARVGYAHPYFHASKRRNCDGDEDCIMLLLDGLVNFSRSFLPEKRGGLMDAPLVLTPRIDPSEIDKEAYSIDLGFNYPLEFYEATTRYEKPRKVEKLIDNVGKRIGTVLQYEGFGFTNGTNDIAKGPLKSAYTHGSMIAKMERQLELEKKIMAVDASDVVSRTIVHHFLPDLIGNLNAFSSQKLRCTKCNAKFRRMPLGGRCLKCGGNLTLTVNENSVKKYLEISKKISEKYGVSNYLQQRLELIDCAIQSLFTNEKVQHLKLDDFC